MTERCRCGAGLIAELSHCVMCGTARRPQAVLVGAARPGVPAPYRPVAPVAHPSLPPRPAPAPWPVQYQPHHQPAARSAAPWVAGAAAIVALAVVAAVAVLALGPALTATPAAAPSSVLVPSTTTVTAPAVDTASGAGSTGSGRDDLDAQVTTDRAAVEGLVGEWVPQLSSKAIGTVDAGVDYDADAILEHYRELVTTHPDAKLLDSGDWPVFRHAGYWVVVVAQPFSTASGANAWCAAQGIAADQCFAKKLSHSGGPAGTTVQR